MPILYCCYIPAANGIWAFLFAAMVAGLEATLSSFSGNIVRHLGRQLLDTDLLSELTQLQIINCPGNNDGYYCERSPLVLAGVTFLGTQFSVLKMSQSNGQLLKCVA